MLSADHELQLIRDAQHDRTRFGPLYDAYVDLVWRFAMKRLGNVERASDATSQTFIKAMAALPSFQPGRRGESTTFRSWLLTIARNAVIDEARKQREVSGIDLEERMLLADPDPLPEDRAVTAEEIERVQSALGNLPDQHRIIVEMRAHGAGVREIAGALGLSESAVKSAHYRAHQKLRQLLTEEDAF